MEAALKELETALGHVFRAPELLVRALTHRSLAKELAAQEHQLESGIEEAAQPAAAGPATMSGWSFWAMRCWGWW